METRGLSGKAGKGLSGWKGSLVQPSRLSPLAPKPAAPLSPPSPSTGSLLPQPEIQSRLLLCTSYCGEGRRHPRESLGTPAPDKSSRDLYIAHSCLGGCDFCLPLAPIPGLAASTAWELWVRETQRRKTVWKAKSSGIWGWNFQLFSWGFFHCNGMSEGAAASSWEKPWAGICWVPWSCTRAQLLSTARSSGGVRTIHE